MLSAENVVTKHSYSYHTRIFINRRMVEKCHA